MKLFARMNCQAVALRRLILVTSLSLAVEDTESHAFLREGVDLS